MKIKWLGHSCFLMTSSCGTRILTDPFDEKVGYRLPSVEANIVTTSHNHFDHGNIRAVKGNFTHYGKPGEFAARDVKIKGVATFHDESNGTKRGENTVFIFEIDGMRICHCGDLGHILSPQQVSEIGSVDVLLVPVGGTFTINYEGAVKVVEQLKPVVTIPMHYRTHVLTFALDSVDRFLSRIGNSNKLGLQEIELDKGSLEKYRGVVVLEYK